MPLEIVPLPYDPATLDGLSARLIASHHQNNYGGALRNLVATRAKIAETTRDTPPFVLAGLMERELTFRNSVVLHELYFGNLGGNGQATQAMATRIAHTYGSVTRWEELFRAAAMGLAGGSGWVVLAWDARTQELRTHWSGHHTQAMVAGAPLLVLDMYEHAFHIDYGAAAAKYVDAFLRNVSWEEVERRLATIA